jgi:glutaminyl-tRNA synthetase
VKGTIHWVSARHAVPAEVRLYDRLFSVPNPDSEAEGKTYRDYLNPESRHVVRAYRRTRGRRCGARAELPVRSASGYFVADRKDHRSTTPVFNRSVTLRDTWSAKA